MRWYLIRHSFVSSSGSSCSLQVHWDSGEDVFWQCGILVFHAFSCPLLYKQILEAETSRAFPQTLESRDLSPGRINKPTQLFFFSRQEVDEGVAFWKRALPGPGAACPDAQCFPSAQV